MFILRSLFWVCQRLTQQQQTRNQSQTQKLKAKTRAKAEREEEKRQFYDHYFIIDPAKFVYLVLFGQIVAAYYLRQTRQK